MAMRGAGVAPVVVALGLAQTLAWGSTYYLPAILAGPMAADLGVAVEWVFAAFSGALVAAAIAGPEAGRRIDRRGGRDVLAASNLVFAAGLALLGLAEGIATLTAGWLVVGLGMAMGLYEAAFSTLAGIYGRAARSPITGITLFAGFASTVCWPITALLDAEIGWRATCFVWAAAHLLVGLPLNRLFVPRGVQPPPVPAVGASATTTATTAAPPAARQLLADRAMLLMAVAFAITWFTSTAMAAHLPRLLQEAGATAGAAIAAAALVGPAQVAARVLEFGLLRRFHPLLSARLAAAAHPLGAAVLMAFGAPAAAAFTVLHGAGNGVLTIAKGTLPLAVFGPAGYGHRQGLLMAPARLGQAVAPFAFALLIERYGAAAVLASGALGLVGVAALLLLTPAATAERA